MWRENCLYWKTQSYSTQKKRKKPYTEAQDYWAVDAQFNAEYRFMEVVHVCMCLWEFAIYIQKIWRSHMANMSWTNNCLWLGYLVPNWKGPQLQPSLTINCVHKIGKHFAKADLGLQHLSAELQEGYEAENSTVLCFLMMPWLWWPSHLL